MREVKLKHQEGLAPLGLWITLAKVKSHTPLWIKQHAK